MKPLFGNALVGQSGGPTAAINATLAGVIRGAKAAIAQGVIGKIYGMRNGVEGLFEENLIDLGAFFDTEYKLDDLAHTPAAALGSCRLKLPAAGTGEEKYAKLLEIFRKYDIRYFFYIGGNDSMDTVAKLSAYTARQNYEMRIIGVPKTIDNDLVGTDHTPGFGSAAKYIATTMQEIIRDCAVYTTKAVTIVEIMGRDAGWLTASAALPRIVHGNRAAPDYVYLPERPFSMEQFFADIRAAFENHPNVVIAVSEGLRFPDGKYVCEGEHSGRDVFGHVQLSGTGKVLEFAVKDAFGCKVRSVELNIPQRCAAHLASETDLKESISVGQGAVEAALAGVTGHMMTMIRSEAGYSITVSSSDVSEIANKVKKVPDSFINEAGNNITDECLYHILPLIQGEPKLRFKNGLPVHIVL